jgi:hypothetical protein
MNGTGNEREMCLHLYPNLPWRAVGEGPAGKILDPLTGNIAYTLHGPRRRSGRFAFVMLRRSTTAAARCTVRRA